MSNNDKQVYWDSEKEKLYWIEWIETGNNDIPKRHYIDLWGGNVLTDKEN